MLVGVTFRTIWAENLKKGFDKDNRLKISWFVLISGPIFFFFFAFRIAEYLDFNAPTAPSHTSQYTVWQFGLFWFCLLAQKLLPKKQSIDPFWTSFCIDCQECFRVHYYWHFGVSKNPKRSVPNPLKSFPIVLPKTMGKLFAFFRISFQSFPYIFSE